MAPMSTGNSESDAPRLYVAHSGWTLPRVVFAGGCRAAAWWQHGQQNRDCEISPRGITVLCCYSGLTGREAGCAGYSGLPQTVTRLDEACAGTESVVSCRPLAG
jgi:hypothetical protein